MQIGSGIFCFVIVVHISRNNSVCNVRYSSTSYLNVVVYLAKIGDILICPTYKGKMAVCPLKFVNEWPRKEASNLAGLIKFLLF